MTDMDGIPRTSVYPARAVVWFVLFCLAVDLSKGLVNIWLAPPETWFLADAVYRVLLLAGLWLWLPSRRIILAAVDPRAGPMRWLAPLGVIVILTPMDPILFGHLGKFLSSQFSGTEFFDYPADYPWPWLRWFDLTVGLFLVALSEEIVFRKMAREILGRWTNSRWVVIAISAVLFGLFHWAAGLDNIILTTFLGAVFMAAYMVCRVLWPMVVMHYLTDLYTFAQI